jgi:hypothetical protein
LKGEVWKSTGIKEEWVEELSLCLNIICIFVRRKEVQDADLSKIGGY